MTQFCGSGHYEVRAALSRRGFLKAAGIGAGVAAGSATVTGLNGLVGELAAAEKAAASAGLKRAVDNRPKMILIWLGGGPTHIDTFDPKEGSSNHGPWKSSATKVPGVHISEKLPELAKVFHSHFSLVRGLNTREGAHERGTWLMHTGSPMIPGDDKPGLGSFVSFEHGDPNLDLPPVWSVRSASHAGGFLGAAHNPFIVNDPLNPVGNLKYYPGIDKSRFDERLAMMQGISSGFETGRPDAEGLKAHKKMYEKADAMIHSPRIKEILDITKVDAKVKERYSPAPAQGAAAGGRMMGGGNGFGMGLLLAKRLVENGVSFVEVGLGGWDMHNNIFPAAEARMHEFDKPLASLLEDLKTDGLLSNTLVVMCGEFGRTPKINGNAGRDHWGTAMNVLVAGAGTKPGVVIGDTDKDGYQAEKDPVDVHDLFRTFSKALKLDANKNYYSKTGRPVRIVEAEKGKVFEKLFA